MELVMESSYSVSEENCECGCYDHCLCDTETCLCDNDGGGGCAKY